MMARGNDGNLFQHVVEVEAAAFLLEAPASNGIYFVSTHGMAPSEPLDDDSSPSRAKTSTLLRSKLRVASNAGGSVAMQPLIVQDFSGLGASPTAYPNSARVVEWIARERGYALRGAVTETLPKNLALLRAHFKDPSVQIISGSWRTNLEQLQPPEDLASSWMFSMDPMKFTNGKDANNDRMTGADLPRLAPIWASYLARSDRGLIALFSYSMRMDEREHFLATVDKHTFPELLGVKLGVLEVLNYISDYHVAVLMSVDESLLVHLRDRVLEIFGTRARAHDDFPVTSNLFERRS